MKVLVCVEQMWQGLLTGFLSNFQMPILANVIQQLSGQGGARLVQNADQCRKFQLPSLTAGVGEDAIK